MNSESLSGALPPPDPLAAAQRRWRPLSAIQRRVVGVLVEKAKTTPEQYPLSLNGLTTGSNQKSNRHPLMNLDTDQVEQALEELRSLGAVVEIQSGGRVAKYKHCLYEWLGVDKAELAVMTELLLRGEQTVGELRGRAARMEPIADLDALRPVLASLIAKELVVELTPEGRGQVVSHALHREHELAALKEQYQRGGNAEAERRSPALTESVPSDALARLAAEVAQLRADLENLRALVREWIDGSG